MENNKVLIHGRNVEYVYSDLVGRSNVRFVSGTIITVKEDLSCIEHQLNNFICFELTLG
jgi:hypothetical protein